MDLTEAKVIKKRWQEYTEELYKKDLHDPDNHDVVITYLETDILECKSIWALGSITTNKASGRDGITAELFQILKVDIKVLHSVCQEIWKTQQWSLDWKRSVFIPIPKKGSTNQCANYHTIAFNSHASKVMLKILQERLQQYVNWELPDVPAGFRKGRETRDQIANIRWIIEKAEKHLLLLYWLCWGLWLCGSQQTGQLFKRREYQTTLPTSWETYMQVKKQVRTRHGAMVWLQTGKGVHQGCILSPCLFNVYAEYILWNAGLDESQAGISIAPGGLVVRNPGFHPGLISGQGTKILLQTTAHCSVSKISRS